MKEKYKLWSIILVGGGLFLMWCAPFLGHWLKRTYNLRAPILTHDAIIFHTFMTVAILLTGLLFAVGGTVLFFRKVL